MNSSGACAPQEESSYPAAAILTVMQTDWVQTDQSQVHCLFIPEKLQILRNNHTHDRVHYASVFLGQQGILVTYFIPQTAKDKPIKGMASASLGLSKCPGCGSISNRLPFVPWDGCVQYSVCSQ